MEGEGMTCKEIIYVIRQRYPEKYALEWDNVGLLAGRTDKAVKRIFVALDATDEVIEGAAEKDADMLITHHPLIFTGLKRVTDENFIGARILKLIQNDISYYAMHTNYDVKGMAELSLKKMGWEGGEVLEVTALDDAGKEEGIGRIVDIEPVTLREMCGQVKKAFALDSVKAAGDMSASVRRAAICPGSGKSVISEALKKGADVLITGDIGHHEGIDAVAQGMMIIDAGHYGVEHIFMEDIKVYLEENIPDAEILTTDIKHPFSVL